MVEAREQKMREKHREPDKQLQERRKTKERKTDSGKEERESLSV